MKRKIAAFLLLLSLLLSLCACGRGPDTAELIAQGRSLYYGEGNEYGLPELEQAKAAFLECGGEESEALYFLGRIAEAQKNEVKARGYYEDAAAQGSGLALLALGEMELRSGKKENYAAAAELFRQALDTGCAEANCGLGDIYRYGYGETANAELAISYYKRVLDGRETEWRAYAYAAMGEITFDSLGEYKEALTYFDRAAELNNPLALGMLGYMYMNGLGTELDNDKAFACFTHAEAFGQQPAGYYLGRMYEKGLGTEVDLARAHKLYEDAAAAGECEAYNQLGYLYLSGIGVTADVVKAIEYLETGAELGSANAYYNLGWIYANAEGIEHDEAMTVSCYEHAAELGNLSAYYELVPLYLNGIGTAAAPEKAITCLEAIASAGDASALTALAWMYMQGIGAEADYELARATAENALSLGDEAAAYVIGMLYENGWGMEYRNVYTAMRYYSRAAAVDVADAYYALGRLYETGDGVAANRDSALENYRQAAELGSEEAAAALTRLGE